MTVFSPVYFEVIDIFNRIRKTDAQVPIVLGGPYVTTIGEEIFRKPQPTMQFMAKER